MEKRDDGGRVIPRFEASSPNRLFVDYTIVPVGGMTMRQWYKGMALAAVYIADITSEQMAKVASEIGDELIAEDKKATRGEA